MSLFFLATGQPPFESSKGGPSDATPSLTLEDRRALAQLMGARKTGHIPVCVDHAGGELQAGSRQFKVPNDKQVGRVIDTFVVGDQLLHSIEIYHDYPELIAQIVDDIEQQRQPPWGVSLGTDFIQTPDVPGVRPEILGKAISHVGITRDPLYGSAPNGATLIHLAARTPEAFYRALKAELLDKRPDTYMADATRARILTLAAAPEEQQQQPAQEEVPPAESVPSGPLEPAPAPAAEEVPAPLPPAETETIAAMADATQGGLSDEVKYKQFRERYEGFLKGIWPNGPENTKESVLSDSLFTEACRLLYDLTAISKGKGYDGMPDSAHEAYGVVKKYITHATEVADNEGGRYYKNNPGAMANLKAGLDLHNIVKERPADNAFGPVQTVLAMRSIIEANTVASHETQRLEFEARRKAFEEKEAEQKALLDKAAEETTAFKRKYDEAFATATKAQELADALDKELKLKKTKLEALESSSPAALSAAAASRLTSELSAATSVPGATAAGAIVPPPIESSAASRNPASSPSLSFPSSQLPPKPHVDDKFNKLFDPSRIAEVASASTSHWSNMKSDPIHAVQYKFF
jgi:hypothetical protein